MIGVLVVDDDFMVARSIEVRRADRGLPGRRHRPHRGGSAGQRRGPGAGPRAARRTPAGHERPRGAPQAAYTRRRRAGVVMVTAERDARRSGWRCTAARCSTSSSRSSTPTSRSAWTGSAALVHPGCRRRRPGRHRPGLRQPATGAPAPLPKGLSPEPRISSRRATTGAGVRRPSAEPAGCPGSAPGATSSTSSAGPPKVRLQYGSAGRPEHLYRLA